MAWSPLSISPPPFPQLKPPMPVAHSSFQMDNPPLQQSFVEQSRRESASYAESSIHQDSLLLEDVQSFLSENWDGPSHDVCLPNFSPCYEPSKIQPDLYTSTHGTQVTQVMRQGSHRFQTYSMGGGGRQYRDWYVLCIHLQQ